MAEVEVSTLDGPGSSPLLTLIGDFDAFNMGLVEEHLTLWVAQGHRHAVLDVTRTWFIDSAMIGALVSAQIAGLALTIRGASGLVRVALDIAGADQIFKVDSVRP